MLDIKKEIEFWTRIMRDHGEFQYTNLSPKEVDTIQTASYFMNLFNGLHEEVKSLAGELSPPVLSNLISKNMMALGQFIQFKRGLLARLMQCDIELGFPPSFINHMINEAMEYHRVLCMTQGTILFNKTLENIRLHKIWLPDASGHASSIAAALDPIETELIHKAEKFMKRFDNLFKKAFEMFKMFERTGLEDGGLQYFNQEVEEELQKFIGYLEKIKEVRSHCKVYATGMASPLMPDHMIREEKYYIYRIQVLHQ
ncbi:MAG: hypothetical protein K0R93_928 [Anaerosolibacter sp.]|jgi:hypothetical protein|uniref:DUF2935 domain-containing protein n=1 Tax=Anaerosolibacter sp. TaxID=1872527 RepID=UPI002617480A|nr:DUF2935 domain-containing protein [Anaerosolibacter sp.]MDF2546030.1 hypothetical protein [Anaerosolibacter sp.]